MHYSEIEFDTGLEPKLV